MAEITEQQIRVRQVTDYQPTWVEHEPGQAGTFTIQLVLDNGAEEYILRPTADDTDVLVTLLSGAETVFFDLDRKVLMFGNRSTT